MAGWEAVIAFEESPFASDETGPLPAGGQLQKIHNDRAVKQRFGGQRAGLASLGVVLPFAVKIKAGRQR